MSTGGTSCSESAHAGRPAKAGRYICALEPGNSGDTGRPRGGRRRRDRRYCNWSLLLLRLVRRRRLTRGAGLLQRFEVDEREIVLEDGADLVRLGLRQVPLRLNHEEAGRQAHLESLLLRIEPLCGKLA